MIAWHDLPLLGLVAAFSAFVGSGGSTILLPVRVLYYGVHDAVPILTIANVSANVSRIDHQSPGGSGQSELYVVF